MVPLCLPISLHVFRDGGGDMQDNLNTWLDLYYVFFPYSKTFQTEITSHIHCHSSYYIHMYNAILHAYSNSVHGIQISVISSQS